MLEKYHGYFLDIKLSKVQVDRIEKLYENNKSYIDDEIKYICVENIFDENNNIQYIYLNLLSDNCWYGFGNFMTENSFSVSKLDCVDYLKMKKNFLLKTDINDTSEIVISIKKKGSTSLGELRGVGLNCKYIVNIYEEYLLPLYKRSNE